VRLTRLVAWALLPVAVALTACAGGAAPASPDGGDQGVALDADQWSYAESLTVGAPLDLAHPALPACATVPLGPGWLARENALPGSPSWRPADVLGVHRIPLYLDQPSTVCGSPVAVHVGGDGAHGVVVRAYRIGWYAGAGARLVWSSAPVDVPHDPGPARLGDTLPSPGWTTTVALPVDATWTPGQYLVETWDQAGLGGVASLVVRDDADRGGLVVMHSNLTWAAYSQFGASSLYKGDDGRADTRALETALQRPTTGAGVSRLLVNDVPVTQFLEEHAIAARHVVDTDVDAWPSIATSATEIVLPGHSEYWTRRMYDAVLAARNGGVNLADLGANEVYWQGRLDRDSSGVPTTLTVARTLAQDPLAAAHPDQATVRWYTGPLNRDGSALIGQRYSAIRARGSMQVWSLPPWLRVGTGLRPGAILDGVVANEADGVRPGSPATPTDLQTVLLGVLERHGSPDQLVSTTYYTAQSGAAVFAAGTTYWACDLTDACPDNVAPRSTQQTVRAMTLDVIAGFLSPQFGRLNPSVRDVPRDVASARAAVTPAAVGQYGY